MFCKNLFSEIVVFVNSVIIMKACKVEMKRYMIGVTNLLIVIKKAGTGWVINP